MLSDILRNAVVLLRLQWTRRVRLCVWVLIFKLMVRTKVRLRLFDVNSSLSGGSILLVFYLDLNLLVSVPPHVPVVTRERLRDVWLSSLHTFVLIDHHIVVSFLNFRS
jgi:hypothetical protein